MRKHKPKKCKGCGEQFTPTVGRQWYCGSKTEKTGCSHKNIARFHKEKGKKYRKDPEFRARMNEYQKQWKKDQRKNNTEYAKRQRELKKALNKTPKGRAAAKASSRRNIKTKLACNRRRALRKKGVIGSHTEKQWLKLKEDKRNKCAICGVPEDHLQQLCGGRWLSKLTKDHIIPISKGGTDHINNIQPACVSCNSSKHSAIQETIACISGGFDIFHVGHLDLLRGAAQYGKVIVILNSDEWLIRKKGYSIYPTWEERANIVYGFSGVIGVSAVDDSDGTVCEALRRIKPDYFCNGGDRFAESTPELRMCGDLGIKPVFNVGGGKRQSSSDLVKNIALTMPRKGFIADIYESYITDGGSQDFQTWKTNNLNEVARAVYQDA